MATESQEEAWLLAARKHRHDVLNGLQLIQGYLQLGKMDRALLAVHDLARWLQTLSFVQSSLDETESALLQAACSSPHILMTSLSKERSLTAMEVAVLSTLILTLDETAAELGEIAVDVTLTVPSVLGPAVVIRASQQFVASVQNRSEITETVHGKGIHIGFEGEV